MGPNFKNQDHTKANYRGKCMYLLMLIKSINPKVWERLSAPFQGTPNDQT